jgi:hypothetical protein
MWDSERAATIRLLLLNCHRLQASNDWVCAKITTQRHLLHWLLVHRQTVAAAPVGTGRTAAVLEDASNCLQGSVELKLPDDKVAAAYELKPGSFNQAASDPEVARHMDECLADWCRQVRMQWDSNHLNADALC